MAWPEKEKIRQGVASMLDVNLAVQDGEKVLVMTDPPTLKQWGELGLEGLLEMLERCVLARIVADLATEVTPSSDITFLPYLTTGRNGAEPDGDTAKRMQASDVIIAINTYSLTHTMATHEACGGGARMASMPEFLAEMFESLMADPHRISQESTQMAELLTEARTASVSTPLGTDLTLDLQGRSGGVESGLLTARGSLGNLPAGEAYIAPVEGKAEGVIVVPAKGYPKLEEQMTIRVKRGVVCAIEGGGKVGEEFRALLELPTPGRQGARRNLAELGIGSNPRAQLVDNTLEGEKIKGTVHIAIGDNAFLGGGVTADIHEDFVLSQPDLSLDGRVVIRAGEWLV